ncbi:MAG: RNA methyltransferase, partial [Deltaproteobacteria bacterium]|nr:RNA methyltransferase [Deltaproteobacteria bacterium]
MNIGILKNLTIVLVGSQGARNIGSVARAMANFGTSDLRLVNPQIDHLQDESRKMAVKATPVLEQAKIYNSLQDALQDCHFAYGTTRRFGKYRVDFFHPDDAAEQLLPLLDQGRVAFVFGREDQGLTTEELL